MRKLRMSNKIILTAAAIGITGASVGICLTTKNVSYSPLHYSQEVDAERYAQGKEKSQPINLFPHNYHSLDFDYQKLYWLDITRENIHDLVYDTSTTEFNPYHVSADDLTLDRFTNLFYPSNTIISLWNKGSTIDDEGKPYSGEGLFKEQSVITSWTSQNGFAYISDINEPFDTQSERDEYKKWHTQAQYDTMLEKYNKANSFLNVFGGNRDVAQYFFSGIKTYGNNSKGIKDDEQVDNQYINIETAKFTRYSIQQFVNWLIANSSTRGEIELDFSQLYLTDLDRDNSVLALLNPQLWEYLLLSCYDEETTYTTKISKIDLSYNNLRAIPNIASIRNKKDTDWFWEDSDGELHIGYDEATYHVGGMNKICEGSVGILDSAQADGYFDGIDLSHNNLTYFDFSAYNPYDETIEGWGEGYGKKQSLIDSTKGSSRVPSVATLVKCRYEDYADVYDIDVIMDPSILKPKSENLIGVNIDYNRLPWILMNPLVNENDANYVWWRPMLESWFGLKIKEIAELIGLNLPDYILTCARAYLTYTVANYRSDAIDGMLAVLEYIFGLGTYQVDGINWTDQEIYNYINLNEDSFGRDLMIEKTSSGISLKEVQQLYDKYIRKFISVGQLTSFPLDRSLVDADVIKISPRLDTKNYTSDDITGTFEIPLVFELARIEYLPDSFAIDEDTSLNDLATRIFNTISINHFTFINVPGFVKDYAPAIGVSAGLTAVMLLIMIIVIIRLITNIRHQYEYRRNELGAELVTNKKKKAKKAKKGK